jgi:TolA-binding protein
MAMSAKNRRTAAGLPRAAGAMLLLVASLCLFAQEKADDWRMRESITARLCGEWYKINVLTRELSSVKEIIADLRDMELFPAEVTRCSEDSLVAIDRKLDVCEKYQAALQARVSALKPPLADALAILREMVTNQPVEDMFSVLDNDNIRRISELFTVKHFVDSLWADIDALTSGLAIRMQLSPSLREQGDRGVEAEFFNIISANLGERAQRYYRALDVMKDSLVQRGNDDQIRRMYQIELHRIKAYFSQGEDRLALEKLPSTIQRYEKQAFKDELSVLLMRAYLSQGQFDQVLRTGKLVSDTARFGSDLVFLGLQSLYASKRFDALWKWGSAYGFEPLSGSRRNCALWVVMESGLALSKQDRFNELASLVVKDSSYALHVMHALGRFYLQKRDFQTALSVFEGALRFSPQTDNDKRAYQSIRLAVAQTWYEQGNFEKARSLFFELLNSGDEDTFADALYGISWCYIRLGMYQKAETSLRKLVNQVPASPLAVKALLTMGQRFVNKAQFEWEKLTYTAGTEYKLGRLRARLLEKAPSSEAARRQVETAVGRIDELLGRMKKEKRVDDAGIASYYDEALRISSLLERCYSTGTYQEVSFTEKREQLLHQLDSTLLDIKGGRAGTPGRDMAVADAAQNQSDIKALILKSKVFTVETQIDRYRWEREHCDVAKSAVKRALDDCAAKAGVAKDAGDVRALALAKAALEARMDSLVKAGDGLNERWYSYLTNACEALFTAPLDPADEIYLRYHDAEQHYAHENELFSAAYAVYENRMTAYDSIMALFRDGKVEGMPVRPAEPKLAHDSSMAQYRILLSKYPKADMTYAVRYSLAWCFNDIGLFDSAVAQMDSVALRYPSCQYAPQAWMYVGEHMFDHGRLEDALKAYQAVLNYPESEWFDNALYKLAWAQYRLSNPEKAISSFLALVDLGDKAPQGKSLLEKESIDYIAISFSETDITGEKGLERATNFVRRFGDPAKGTQILHRLASIYKDQGRFEMAQKTYRALLKMYPEYRQSPLIESELLAVMEKSSTTEEANIRHVEFFNKYGKNGDWAKAQTDAGAIVMADSLAASHLYDAAVSYHQLALQKNDTLLYSTASEEYEDFIRSYPKSTHAGECHYNLAEIQFSMGNYKRAAEEYIAVSKRYPDSKYRETAAWNAIVASQNFLKKEGTASR